MDANTASDRVSSWLQKFHAYIAKEDLALLPLYSQRIHFLPREDKEETIGVGLDDLHESYTSHENIKRMRELFETFAKDHEV